MFMLAARTWLPCYKVQSPDWVHRVCTDDRSVSEVAADVIAITGWLPESR
jgi:hypothetical protein